MINYRYSLCYMKPDCIYYLQVPFLTASISESYIGHNHWLINKFFANLKHGTRGYSFAVDDYHLAGCSLLKNEEDERKICCLFIDPNYRRQGIASHLIEDSFRLLNTDKPLMTVSEQNLAQLQPLIKRYNFELTSVRKSVYKQGVNEYFYNEGLAR